MVCKRVAVIVAATLFVLATAHRPARAADTALSAFLADAARLAQSDFATVKGAQLTTSTAAYATTLAPSSAVTNCKINSTEFGWQLECVLPRFANADGAAAVAAIDAALPPGFVRHGPASPTVNGRDWPLWRRNGDHLFVSLNGYFSPVHLTIVQYEKPPSSALLDGTVTPVPLVWERDETHASISVGIGSGVVVGEDALHSYVVARLSGSFVGDTIRVGDPLTPLRWKLVGSSVVVRDDTSSLALLATPRLHVRPARFIRTPVAGADVQVVSHQHWTAKWMGRTWTDPGDPPAGPFDLGSSLQAEAGTIAAVQPARGSFDFTPGRTEWRSALVLDSARHAVVGFAGTRVPGATTDATAVSAAQIAVLLERGKRDLNYDGTVLVAKESPAPRISPKPVADTGLARFIQQALTLAGDDFAAIRGARDPVIPNWYATTGFTADPAVVSDCRIDEYSAWSLDCALPSFSEHGTSVVSAVEAALPPGFVRTGPANPDASTFPWPFWSRLEDYRIVALNGALSPRSAVRLSVRRYGQPPAAIDTLDGSITPVPLVWRHADDHGVTLFQSVGSGIVVAEDSRASYVVGKLDLWELPETILIGSPRDAERWTMVRPVLRTRDSATGLALFAVPKLKIRPARFLKNPVQGERIGAVFSEEAFFVTSEHDDLRARIHRDEGIVSAVHTSPPTFDYTAGGTNGWQGGIVFDAARGIAVGFPYETLHRASGAYLAHSAATIEALLRTQNLALDYAAAAASTDRFATLLASVARIAAGAEVGSGVIVDPPGAGPEESYVLTAAHVLKGRTRATVFLPSLRDGVEARLVRRDAQRDLALLAFPRVKVAAVSLAANVRRGGQIGVVGFPRSSYAFVRYHDNIVPKLNEGLVDSIDEPGGTMAYDAVTDEGNSGGPIVDLESYSLVGIVRGEPAPGSGTYVGAALPAIRAFLAARP
jgi:Trypsin-like peptidase domain